MAAAQRESGLATQHVYGLVWRRTLQEFADVIPDVVAGARRLKVPRAGYQVVAVNDVALFPWRYAKDAATDPWKVAMGDPPSPTRQGILRGVRRDTRQLEFEFDPPVLTPVEEVDADDDERSVLVELAKLTRTVVVVRYASSAAALLRVLWGDGQLQDDGTVLGRFGEELAVPPVGQRRTG
jgi:hypothetical protein